MQSLPAFFPVGQVKLVDIECDARILENGDEVLDKPIVNLFAAHFPRRFETGVLSLQLSMFLE